MRITLLALTALLLGVAARSRAALPSKPAPSWSLVNQEGQSFGSTNLRGKVALVTFVYTNCPTVCPTLTRQMKQLQDELKKKGVYGQRVVFVSMSVDPERDTPARLKEYGTLQGVDFAGWTWVTGQADDAERTWQAFGVMALREVGGSHASHGASQSPLLPRMRVMRSCTLPRQC